MWIPDSRSEVVLICADRSCNSRDEHTGKILSTDKSGKHFPLLCFTFHWLTPSLPCCHCLALMNLNKLTFSLADKYLSNPAKERQFSLTQLITSHLYVFCGWIILSQGWNNIPSHCKQLLCNPTPVLLLCIGFFSLSLSLMNEAVAALVALVVSLTLHAHYFPVPGIGKCSPIFKSLH